MVNRMFDTGGYNTNTNKSIEGVPMFDRRKALITAAEIVDEWLERIEDRSIHISAQQMDLLHEVIEKHLERVFKRGYMSAINANSPDNQKSE